jgi:hypothetical protein
VHRARVDIELANPLVVDGTPHLEHGQAALHLAEHLDVPQQDDRIRERRREWKIVREEVERVIRRAAGVLPRRNISEALITADRLLESAEHTSVRSLLQCLSTSDAIVH